MSDNPNPPVDEEPDQLPAVQLAPPPVQPVGFVDRIRNNHRLPDLITTPQPSIADLIEEATTPEPGETEPPAFRVVWAKGVALPIKIMAGLGSWLAESPERLIPAIVLTFVAGTAVSQLDIPVLSWLIPRFLDVTSWF